MLLCFILEFLGRNFNLSNFRFGKRAGETSSFSAFYPYDY